MNTSAKILAAAAISLAAFGASAMTVVKAQPVTVVGKRVQIVMNVVKAEPITVVAKAPVSVQIAKAVSKANRV